MSKKKSIVENSKEVILSWFEVDDSAYKRAQVLAYIQDKKIPFEDRKEVWLATPPYLGTDYQYVVDLPDFEKKYGEISWYDDFYMERHENRMLVDMLDSSYFEVEGAEVPYFDQKKIDDFIAACMKAGVNSFTFDW